MKQVNRLGIGILFLFIALVFFTMGDISTSLAYAILGFIFHMIGYVAMLGCGVFFIIAFFTKEP